MKTYCFASNTELFVVPAKDGRTDLDALKEVLGDDAACFYLQQPNYFGQIEDAKAIGELVHAAGAKFVMGVNPIACALLPTPREMGADIAVGDGRTFTIEAEGTSPENKYIQSITLNGKPYRSLWLDHADLMKGYDSRTVREKDREKQ